MRKGYKYGLAAVAVGGLMALSGCGSSSSTPPFVPIITSPTITTGLWVANGNNVLEFGPNQFVAGATDPAPQEVINSSAFTAPQGVQFDSNGNLWVIDGGNTITGGSNPPALFFFTSTQLANLHSDNNILPTVTLQSSDFAFPQQAVFFGGNLWVTDNGANEIFVFNSTELGSGGGNVTPFQSLSSQTPFTGPLGIAFDPLTGNLWVANNGTTTLFEFNNSSLPTNSGASTLTNGVTLSNNNGSINAPWGLIFDSLGDLYSSNALAPNTVVEFTHSQLGTTSAPQPAITIPPVNVGTVISLNSPNGVALDNLGDLAAINSAGDFGIPFYSQDQLFSSNFQPEIFLQGVTTTLNAPAGCTFGPNVP